MAQYQGIDLLKVEYMRDYIAHLKFSRERLIETFLSVHNHSQYVANEIWQDKMSTQFMDMLDEKQKDLYRITEEFEHYRNVMQSQLDIAEEIEQQTIPT